MADYSGALQSFATCSTLWTVPVFPLFAATLGALWSRTRRGNDNGDTRAARVAAVCAAISFLSALAHAVWLASLPVEQRSLLDQIAVSARIGTLDASLSLTMDALSAVLAVFVAAAGVAIHVHAATTLRALPGQAKHVAALALGLGALQLLILASDFVLMFVGWHAVGIATLLLVASQSSSGTRAARIGFVTARFADALLLAGVCVLFWTFGGGFSEAGSYAPELKPRLVGVERGAREKGQTERAVQAGDARLPGRLSMSALPDSTVRLGGAELCAIDHDGKRGGLGTAARPCREPVPTPFSRIPVTAAIHEARISAGPGTDELVIQKLRVGTDKETWIALVGPTLNLRELRDQLLLRDESGAFVIRTAIDARRIFGFSALGVALTLLVLAAAAKSAVLPLHAWLKPTTEPPAPSLAIVAVIAGMLAGAISLLRLGFLLPLVPFAAGLAGLLGGLAAVMASARAAFASELRRALALVLAAETGIAFIGIASGALGAALLGLSVALLGVTAALLALAHLADDAGRSLDVGKLDQKKPIPPGLGRISGLATLALAAAPIPALGVFWSREAIGWSAFQGDATEPIPGFLLSALSIAAATLIAFASFRAHHLAFGQRAPREGQRQSTKASKAREPERAASASNPLARLLALACAGLALVVGLLGASSQPFGTNALARSPLDDFIQMPAVGSEPALNPGQGLRIGLLLIGFVLPLLAWRVASKWYGPSSSESPPDKEQALPGHALLTREPLGLVAASVIARDADRIGNLLQRTDRVLAGTATDDLDAPAPAPDFDQPAGDALVEQAESSASPAEGRRPQTRPSASPAEGRRPQTRPSASPAEGRRPQTRPSDERRAGRAKRKRDR